MTVGKPHYWLSFLSKLVCFTTLFLIFVGGLVTSTGSGLAVPDWPLSYGSLFPPMVGGVFYEHGHRMVAATVGFFMLVLALLLGHFEKRRWVRILGWAAFGMVVFQGVLGGITVKFFLPTPVSVFHGVLAQTFFLLTIILAYSQSQERFIREGGDSPAASSMAELSKYHRHFLKGVLVFTVLVYGQLIVAAIMRHTHAGLAIPDFPTMGGYLIPRFDEAMLKTINAWRFDLDLEAVNMGQVQIHFLHRLLAGIIACWLLYLTWQTFKRFSGNLRIVKSILALNLLLIIQMVLGITAVLGRKPPVLTSFHVACGAAVLGMSVLLALRASPLKLGNFSSVLMNSRNFSRHDQ